MILASGAATMVLRKMFGFLVILSIAGSQDFSLDPCLDFTTADPCPGNTRANQTIGVPPDMPTFDNISTCAAYFVCRDNALFLYYCNGTMLYDINYGQCLSRGGKIAPHCQPMCQSSAYLKFLPSATVAPITSPTSSSTTTPITSPTSATSSTTQITSPTPTSTTTTVAVPSSTSITASTSTTTIMTTKVTSQPISASISTSGATISAGQPTTPRLSSSLATPTTTSAPIVVYPTFQLPSTNISILETTAVNTVVLTNIVVIDSSSNTQQLVQLSCNTAMSTTGACSAFSFTANVQTVQEWQGQLIVAQTLNYNIINFYNVCMQATDLTRTNYQCVTVYLIAVQNRPPVFNLLINANVPETTLMGQVIIVYDAIDGNSANPHPIQYSLITNPGNYFALDLNTGKLTNILPLTYSDPNWANGFLTLQVKAAEVINGVPGNDATTVTVISSTITLIDTNTNPPMFDQSNYTGTIVEHRAAGTAVPNLYMVITDADHSPANSKFTLSLDNFNNVWQVAPVNGTGSATATIVVVNGSLLNYDAGPRTYTFNVIARQVNPALTASSSALVTINLSGLNDYPPVFNPTVYNASVVETAPGGTLIITVIATDQDYGYYGNESIWYRLQSTPGYNLFRCDYLTGAITVAPCSTPGTLSCIDYERQQSYQLLLLAVDNYGEGFTATATINIAVINVNDNPPEISNIT